MAGHPLVGKERGIHVLGLLKDMSPNIHSDIEELWDTVIPKLIEYIEGIQCHVITNQATLS